MKDIDININGLEEIIKTLASDNSKIESTINNINIILKKIDSSIWNSPEKENSVFPLISYMEDAKNKLNPNLNLIISVLNEVVNKYKQTDEYLKKSANDIEVL